MCSRKLDLWQVSDGYLHTFGSINGMEISITRLSLITMSLLSQMRSKILKINHCISMFQITLDITNHDKNRSTLVVLE